MCPKCAHSLTQVLTLDEWDSPPPRCPECSRRKPMHQEFKPFGVGGTNLSKAVKLAETIASEDYGVADFKSDGRDGGRPKVRYKDQTPGVAPASWGAAQHALQQAISIGKVTRRETGGIDGLDILQKNIRDGTQVDLIEASKARSAKVW